MDFYEIVLRCRLIIPFVNHNNCDGDCFLRVLPMDSIAMTLRNRPVVPYTAGR